MEVPLVVSPAQLPPLPNAEGGEISAEAALVAAARVGNEAARQQLFLRYHRPIRNLVFRLLGRAHDVDDIVQDAFVEALRALPRLRSDNAFPAWLNSIAITCVRYYLRKQRLLRKIGFGQQEPVDVNLLVAADAPGDVAVEITRLYRALDAMPEKPRIALVMRHVEGRRLEEIAALMKGSISSVKRWVSQGETRLRAAGIEDRTATLHEAPGGGRIR